MDIDTLWLRTLEEVVNRAAHEVKDSLNGVSLNVEVVRSRADRPGAAEGLVALAEANGIKVGGDTLVWHNQLAG